MEDFFKSHTCNEVCKALNLDVECTCDAALARLRVRIMAALSANDPSSIDGNAQLSENELREVTTAYVKFLQDKVLEKQQDDGPSVAVGPDVAGRLTSSGCAIPAGGPSTAAGESAASPAAAAPPAATTSPPAATAPSPAAAAPSAATASPPAAAPSPAAALAAVDAGARKSPPTPQTSVTPSSEEADEAAGSAAERRATLPFNLFRDDSSEERVCRYFSKGLYCTRGAECYFKHASDKPCKWFAESGRCRHGDRCWYSHD
jgi:hypothetical protein